MITALNVGPGRPMPEDGVIQVAFDRYLLPLSVNRQSVALLDANNEPLPPAMAALPLYDPIARTVTLAAPTKPWLTKGLVYKLVFGIPKGDEDIGGLRAIDRATLLPSQTRVFAFAVGEPTQATFEPLIDFCTEIMPIFVAKCASPTCHGSSDRAASGLVLHSSAGIAQTALNRVAQGANTGNASTPVSGSRLFGVDMPLITPGNPGESWLVYKIELARPPSVDPKPPPKVVCERGCDRGCDQGAPSAKEHAAYRPLVNVPPSADEVERDRLSNHVLGREMPYPSVGASSYADQALTFDERERIRLWIAQLPRGAVNVPECGTCKLQ